jgi:hypothetical protein
LEAALFLRDLLFDRLKQVTEFYTREYKEKKKAYLSEREKLNEARVERKPAYVRVSEKERLKRKPKKSHKFHLKLKYLLSQRLNNKKM